MTEQEPDEIPGETLELLRTYVETEHGFLSWLGFTVGTFEPGRMVATVPFDGKPTNPTDPPTVHGGVASTLIDTVGGLVFRPYLEDPIAGDIATINLNLNYLRRATGDLTATGGGHPRRRKRRDRHRLDRKRDARRRETTRRRRTGCLPAVSGVS
jgi:uncharacterized protein (TIGR00369 family)|nr:PaaI family thioesterase [Natronomonas aquatica]